MKKALATLGSLALGAALWGHFEAGWVRRRSLHVWVSGLPEELEGLRVVHLSDFHLGFPSRGERAVERALRWTAARDADLVLITGDLLSRPSAELARDFGLRERRIVQMAAGAGLIEAALDGYRLDHFQASDASLREGAILARARAGEAWREELGRLVTGAWPRP